MRESIIVKVIYNATVAVALVTFFSGAVFIKLFKDIMTKSEIPADTIVEIINQSIGILTVILVILIAVLIIVIYFNIKKIIIFPLQNLRKGMENITSGNLDFKISTSAGIGPKDEINQLAVFFDEMTMRLKASRSNLEEKIKTRTADLGQKLEELESMNKFMVDREIRMIELKDKIALLEKEKEEKVG